MRSTKQDQCSGEALHLACQVYLHMFWVFGDCLFIFLFFLFLLLLLKG